MHLGAFGFKVFYPINVGWGCDAGGYEGWVWVLVGYLKEVQPFEPLKPREELNVGAAEFNPHLIRLRG